MNAMTLFLILAGTGSDAESVGVGSDATALAVAFAVLAVPVLGAWLALADMRKRSREKRSSEGWKL